jgi:hypothetical protein
VTQAAQMLDTYPADLDGVDRDALARCIEECSTCAHTCTACTDACLSEQNIAELATCTRSDLDCADICDATGRVLSRHTGYDANLSRTIVQACVAACKACGNECCASKHEHCRICAEACRRCERACHDLLTSLG